MIRLGHQWATYMAHCKLDNYLILFKFYGGGGGSRTRIYGDDNR